MRLHILNITYSYSDTKTHTQITPSHALDAYRSREIHIYLKIYKYIYILYSIEEKLNDFNYLGFAIRYTHNYYLFYV